MCSSANTWKNPLITQKRRTLHIDTQYVVHTNSIKTHQRIELFMPITVCMVVQNCCKGSFNKYRKCNFWGCSVSKTR